MTPELSAIHEAIKAYLKAIKTGKDEDFERAFYPFAHIINATKDDPAEVKVTRDEFAALIRKRHEDGKATEEIPLGITVSHVGNAANVRLDFELHIGDAVIFGTDYFNMVKHGGEWRITQKIYAVTR
ncbi:MAG: nuclear transport factor 2 family protein [Candidatus Bathyarchaeota archaeon]|nr:nuclear transport factor 2 family protein [Candidatus Bathyarchaeota archaeon]